MGKIVFYGAISLDGYLAAKDDSLQWLFTTPIGEKSTYEDFYQTIDTTVMGRKTYEEAKKMLGTKSLYPEKKNFVFSSKKDLALTDAKVIHEDPVNFVQHLKENTNQTVWIVGGGQLLKPLIENHLIDEWWIQLAPVLLGEGKRLFQEGNYQERLKLVETNCFGAFVELHYVKNKNM